MGELVFVGLGLHDEKGITLRGLDEARAAQVVFTELYTSTLTGSSFDAVERLIGKRQPFGVALDNLMRGRPVDVPKVAARLSELITLPPADPRA